MLWLGFQNVAQPISQGGSRDDLIRGLSAGALGLLGTVATLLYGWIKDRDTIATRTKELDEATRRVAFWESWFKAISPLDSGNDNAYWRERARTEMWYASVTIEELFKRQCPRPFAGSETELYVMGIPKWRRWFLFYKPARSRAWIPRIIFFIYFFAAPFSIPLQYHLERDRNERYIAYEEDRLRSLDAHPSKLPDEVKERADLRERLNYEKSKAPDQGMRLVMYAAGALSCMAFSLLFRSWSLRLEKPVQPLPPSPTVLSVEPLAPQAKRKRSFWWPLR